jgi:adenylate cyclase
MGYGQATSLTAVGDTLNAASRLESLAKDRDAELVISDELATRAGLDLTGRERQTLAVRGRSTPIAAWIITDVTGMAPVSRPRTGEGVPPPRC